MADELNTNACECNIEPGPNDLLTISAGVPCTCGWPESGSTHQHHMTCGGIAHIGPVDA